MTVNFDEMDVNALKEAQQKLHSALSKRKREQIGLAHQQIIEVVKNHGFTLEEVLEYGQKKGKKSTAAKREVPAKYRHPTDSSLTWSGRGKKPRWVQAELDKGAKLESFAI